MSDTIHRNTVLSMIERDVESKYAHIKSQTLQSLTSLSNSIPLLKVALPSAEKWLAGKEKQYLPKVQDMVNMSVEASFAEPDISIDDAYANAKGLINQGIDDLLQANSSFSLESADQLFQILIGTKLSL